MSLAHNASAFEREIWQRRFNLRDVVDIPTPQRCYPVKSRPRLVYAYD